MLKRYWRSLKINRLTLAVIFLGSLSWSLTMVKSGLVYSYGMGFWGPNGHDGIWHISLAESLSGMNLEMPVFAGELVKNYHIGFDLMLAFIHKLTQIPVINLYFQILPPLFALITGILVYNFVYLWRKSNLQALWACFFVYFGGSFGWLVSLVRNRQIGGESLFWAQQSISTLVNPPYALSLIFIFAGLIMLFKGLESKNYNFLMLAVILFGLLAQIKIYASILILAGLGVSGILKAIKEKDSELTKVFAGVLVISAVLFLPLNKNPEKTLVFQPFWFLEQLMLTKDRFYWPRYGEALINYKLAGNFLKGVPAFTVAFLIFILGNFGTRILGFLSILKNGLILKKFNYIGAMIVTIILSGILIPLLFIQSGNSWNSIQFMYYSIVFSGILAGIWLGETLENRKLNNAPRCALIVGVLVLTLPTTLGTLIYDYIPSRPPAKISTDELDALNFLKNRGDGIVLSPLYDAKLAGQAVDFPPRPLYLYESTAYVSALTSKPSFMEDEVNLEITGYNWKFRRSLVERFFRDPAFDGKFELLMKRNVRYVYVPKKLLLYEKDLHLDPDKIFENSEVLVYEVK